MRKINGMAIDGGADQDVDFSYEGFQAALVNAACDEFFRRRGMHTQYNGRRPAKWVAKTPRESDCEQ